jgi:hypothetical protein
VGDCVGLRTGDEVGGLVAGTGLRVGAGAGTSIGAETGSKQEW